MADKITESVIKLSADVDEYVGDMNRAAKSNDALAKSADDYAKAEDRKTKVTRQGRDELQQVEARYSTRFRLEEKLRNEQERMQRLNEKGVGSDQERARVYSIVEKTIRGQIDALDRSGAALNRYGTHMDKAGTTTGLARHEMINFSRQIQDIGVSLAGGQNPLRIAVEQGTQLIDIFATSRATLGGFFSQIASGAARMLTPVRLAIGGIATIGATIGAAAISFSSAQKDVELALLGIGRASGATVSRIEEIAKASTSSFGLSQAEAREFATQLASTGRIGVDQFQELTVKGRDLARALGVNLKEAGDIAAKALSHPGATIDQLNEKLGRWDAATVQLIKNLNEQNRVEEAQALVRKGLIAAADDAAKAASVWEQAWTVATNKISKAWTILGQLGKGIGLVALPIDEQFAAAETKLRNMQEALSKLGGAELAPGMAKAVEAQVAEVERLRAAWQAVGESAAEANRIIQSQAEKKLVRGAVPEVADFEQIRNQAVGLSDLMARINATGGQFSPILREIGESFENVSLAAARTKERMESWLSPAQRATAEFQLQVAAITARTAGERQAVAARQAELQAIQQGLSGEEKRLAIARAVYLEIARTAQAHRDNMAALNDQLRVAQAMPGPAQQVAQYEADINARLREGATLMQAEAEASTKRQIAVEQANRSVDQQIIGLRQAVEMERARMEGTEGAVAAAQAYANAIRSGASETKAAALAAATLEANLERAQIAAENMANQMGRAGSAAGAMGGALGARLDQIGSGLGGAGGWLSPMGPGANLLLTPFRPDRSFGQAPAPPAPPPLSSSSPALTIEFARQAAELARAMGAPEPEAWTQYQASLKQAADGQKQAANDLQSAAAAQVSAAKAAREAQISGLDEAVKEIVATKLLAGQSAVAVNMLIEQGAISFGTASTRFQTQLDLYKRAGASNAQTAAAIRAGIIGEGAKPSELLSALDSLTDAVTANTEAQIGLSDFYTQQGDRQLGYRGFNVQRGGGFGAGAVGGTSGTGGIGGAGTSGTGDGGVAPIGSGGGGIMGGVVNPPLQVSYETGGLGGPHIGTVVNGRYLYWDGTKWADVPNATATRATSDSGRVYSGQLAGYLAFMEGGISGDPRYVSAYAGIPLPPGYVPPPTPAFQYASPMAEGGIVDRAQLAMVGEAGPEAIIPLSGSKARDRLSELFTKTSMPEQSLSGLLKAINVLLTRMAANDDKPAVNIHAPLVHFAAQPTRDEVRESAFQAGQMLRRTAMGGR